MILFIVIATPLQHLKKYPKIYELNYTSIIFKMIQHGLFTLGAMIIYRMAYWDSFTYKFDFLLSIILFLASEVIDAFYFHNVVSITFDLEVLLGNGIMCLIVALFQDTVFNVLKFCMNISMITNTVAFIIFLLFVILKGDESDFFVKQD